MNRTGHHLLFHIKQSQAPGDRPCGKGGACSLFDPASTDAPPAGIRSTFA